MTRALIGPSNHRAPNRLWDNGVVAEPVRVVLVHGSQLSSAQWWRYAALLGPDVDLVSPTCRPTAHAAASRSPGSGPSEVVGGAVDGGTPGMPVVLAGHSLGGYLAMA